MHRSFFTLSSALGGEMLQILQPRVVLSRLELLTPTLSVWCSNQLSYRTVMELCMARNTRDLLFQVLHLLYGYRQSVDKEQSKSTRGHRTSEKKKFSVSLFLFGFRTTLTPIYIHLIPSRRSRKEVFQPHLPVRLPCYDLAPITSFALGRPSR